MGRAKAARGGPDWQRWRRNQREDETVGEKTGQRAEQGTVWAGVASTFKDKGKRNSYTHEEQQPFQFPLSGDDVRIMGRNTAIISKLMKEANLSLDSLFLAPGKLERA